VVKDQRKTTKRVSSLSTKTHSRFVVDFYCPKAKLIIELDGGQHYSEAVQAKDESRDRYMVGVGL
jgi:very-short-patch-repair endonuclease